MVRNAILSKVNSQTASAVRPPKRYDHNATVVRNRLYVLGGLRPFYCDPLPPDNREFFSVDVSVPFTNQGLLWNNLSSTTFNTVPEQVGVATISGGPNNDTLFLFRFNIIYVFDTNTNSWSVIGGIDIKRDSQTAVPHDGKMYL